MWLIFLIILSKADFSFLQFSMCRKYAKALQELRSVSLMKITTSTQLKIKLKLNMVL